VLIGLYALGFIHHALLGRTLASNEISIYRVSWTMIFLTAFCSWLNLLGITGGYHRLWSHGSYKAVLGLRIFLAIIGLMSFQGSARWWALKHRVHHRFTDTEFDPYDSNKGLLYTHIMWLFEAPPYNPKIKLINMRDIDADPGQTNRNIPRGGRKCMRRSISMCDELFADLAS
jgi:fatty-acid desaturase